MKVILRTDITNVGRQGDIKEISAGFARNYLLPRKLVMEANEKNLKLWEREKVKLEKQREETINDAKELAANLEAKTYSIKVNLGENGKIFGSVTAANLSKTFAQAGFEIGKRDILLANNIKEVGEYEINVRLHPEVTAKTKFIIAGEIEEA
ncbi:MAG: 50S ribosomal protein L9 [Elusimicrobiota bacterium]|jgi:large subunit ribosomal protein L9|nr:50S ribosomal protein L9 [Elusimicrobiota bacterium]